MEDTTNPQGGVEQSPADRVMSFLNQEEPDEPTQRETTEAPPEQEAQEQPKDQATDEVTPDDLPPDEDPPAVTVETLEVTHNGQKRTLTRDEATQLAQQGLDYTQKTQALAEKYRQVESWVQRTAEIEQYQEQLAPERAQLAAFETQLKSWQNVDWMKIATEEPLEYPRYQAQYQQLLNGYSQAKTQYEGKAGAVQQARQQMTEQIVRQEFPKMLEKVSEWRDPKKFSEGQTRLKQYLVGDEGYPEDEVNSIMFSRHAVTAYKAMKYDELVRAKADKVKQLRTTPPVVKPGAPQSRDSARADKDKEARQRLRNTGDPRDAAAILLNRLA